MGAKNILRNGKHIAFLLLMAASMKGLSQRPLEPPARSAAPSACLDESAQISIARGDFAAAEAKLRESLAANPLCVDTRFLLAYTLMRRNLAKDSLAEYTAAARLRTPAAADLRNVALDYVLLEDYSDADRWIARALEIDAKDAENWYVLGRIRYISGNFQDAIDSFQHALSIQPGNVKAEDNLGVAYEGLNQIDKATAAYRKAISFGERSGRPSAQPMIDLAIVLEHQSDLDGARDLLARAVDLAPEDARAHENLGHVYLERHELPQAQTELEKAVSLSPADARLHFLLGQVYQREGASERADAEFARFTSLNRSRSTSE